MENKNNIVSPVTVEAVAIFSQLTPENQDAIIDLLKALSSEQSALPAVQK